MPRIVITGASGGIGAALARGYAEAGTDLVLLGRDTARLEAVAALCRVAGAGTETVVLDIGDREATAAAMDRIDEAGPIDILIANAGIQMPTRDDPGDVSPAREEIRINVLGTFDTLEPVARRMAARGTGQIAVVSSLAAYTPLPDSPGYSGSKAALLVLGLALRARLRPAGVRVSVVCPGYVAAGMGRRFRGWKPIVVSAERSATIIRRGLARDRSVIAYPFALALVARATLFLPEWLSRLVLAASRFRVEAAPPDPRDIPGAPHG